MKGTVEQQIEIYCGAKYPRKMKKRLYGTRRQRRRFHLGFIRVLTRRPRLRMNVEVRTVELTVRTVIN